MIELNTEKGIKISVIKLIQSLRNGHARFLDVTGETRKRRFGYVALSRVAIKTLTNIIRKYYPMKSTMEDQTSCVMTFRDDF